ncbi:MAG TPA: TerC family protein [Candidatus Sulfotelmatobacter sp.]|nr:TerC family protein [Candidatus Sulfotelmatobacter sp.]
MTYFPFTEYWWFYLAFSGFVVLLLALDLGVFHRTVRPVSFREATVRSVVWICIALVFNFFLYRYALWTFGRDSRLLQIPGFDVETAARQIGLQFLSGYLVEKALSLDNIFVFVVVFSFFGIPALYHRRVLFYGIFGALLFRGIFIAAGSALLQYHWIMLLFGAFLVLTGIKMMFAPDRAIEPERNPVIRLFRRLVPVTSALHGQRFFVRSSGVLHATPLLVVLLFVEMSDIIFAIDSVPAIFALTREPLVVFTSNILAILGLRALYFLLAGAVERFHLLKYGLAAVLVFVGLKMVWLNDAFGGEFPIGWSLGIICGVLALSILASALRKVDRLKTAIETR